MIHSLVYGEANSDFNYYKNRYSGARLGAIIENENLQLNDMINPFINHIIMLIMTIKSHLTGL